MPEETDQPVVIERGELRIRPAAPQYWRSLSELAGDDMALGRLGDEFAPDADVWFDPVSRRNFLRIMGASLALAGVVGCDDFPDEKIVPYVNQPESVVPGKPSFYATSVPFCGHALGALVESHEGRPTKIEGNPDHPASLGATNVFVQASVLDLYDPDRSKLITHGGIASSWGKFYEILLQRLERGKGDGIRILTRTITSPTFARQLADLKRQFPGLKWHVHDPTVDAGCSARTTGIPSRAVYDFSKANVILSLDADFLVNDVGSLAYARQFADGRRRTPGLSAALQTMNRLYVIETTMSVTGSMADHRRVVKAPELLAMSRAIAAQLGVNFAPSVSGPATNVKFIQALTADLKDQQKTALVVAGDQQPPELQVLARAMNLALGSVGKAVRYIDSPEVPGAESLRSLVADMDAGNVHTLLILGGNPVYDAPADVSFKLALETMTTAHAQSGELRNLTAHLGSHEDETSFACQWHLAESHALEAWGDARAYNGTASVIQPLILPMSPACRSICEFMEALAGRPDRGGYETVRATWQEKWNASHPRSPQTQPAEDTRRRPARSQDDAGTFDEWWQLVLQKGAIDGTAFSPNQIAETLQDAHPTTNNDHSNGKWDIIFRPDPTVWDGQYANNAWLQELPKPFTKLVWDNAAYISIRSAEKLGVRDGDVVRITTEGRAIEAPVLIVPGLANETLTLSLGYGRTRGGHVANENSDSVRGFNAYLLRTSQSAGFSGGARVEAVRGVARTLVMTRSHHAMNESAGYSAVAEGGSLAPHAIEHPGMTDDEIELRSRRLVRSATLDEFRRDEDWVTRLGGEGEMRAKGLSADFPGRKIHLTLYPAKAADDGWDYSKGHQWGMSIDQNTCIGCNACVIACQAENNIPVVGKDQVSRQREMHWIRIDSWFGTQPGASRADAMDDPQVIHMPVACQHCENAPCEVVCPVGATTHSAEGLNEMTYNRCIGTRYCSNNCPYKVRRFNFLLYSDFSSPMRALQYNPDVTVRSRGVMEKCTYCVQRLNRTRMEIEKLTVRLEERADLVEHDSPQRAKALRDALPSHQQELLHQLQTACQQACPTRAIVFGDKNDPDSAVAKLKDDKLDYTLLANLTTQPRTSYMARLRNVNPALA